ncbi:MAG TPA: hypothetical protein DCS93_08715 [Microscillaceae bacterium]|nr:hypothetical protein [Microscillaceae bacterium]
MLQHSTAILIFANTPHQEIRYKDFGKQLPKSRQLKVAQALLQHTRQVAAATKLPVIEILSSHQQGEDFATRFTQAISQVFAQGYTRVISIGTDCPDLQPSDILEAQQQLSTKKAMLGLANDGGAYLIALDQQLFKAEDFQALPWQTAQTAQALIEYFHQQSISPAHLATLKSDIDNFAQLMLAFQELSPTSALYRVIFALLQPQEKSLIWVYAQCYFALFAHLTGLRAPPPTPSFY